MSVHIELNSNVMILFVPLGCWKSIYSDLANDLMTHTCINSGLRSNTEI